MAMKKRFAQLCLKFHDLAADLGLGDAQCMCRGADTARLDHRNEATDQAQRQG